MQVFALPPSTAVGDHLACFALRFSLSCHVLRRSFRPKSQATVPASPFNSVFHTRFCLASIDRSHRQDCPVRPSFQSFAPGFALPPSDTSRKPLCLIQPSSHVPIKTFASPRPTAAGSSLPGPTSLPAKAYGSSGSPDPVGRETSAWFVGRFRHLSSKSETSGT